MDTGGWYPNETPYVTIAEEMRNYAKTNYPGVPSIRDELDSKNIRLLGVDDIQIPIKLIEDYAVAKGVYPSTMAAISLPLKDPWKCEYKYKIPGEHGKYDLFTLGSDHKEGGEGEKADITNWAEASLIGSGLSILQQMLWI